MTSQLPRICFWGCGEMAVRHTRTLRGLFPKIQLLYASRDLAKARRLASKFNGAGAFGGYAEAAGSDMFDISFLTTPHALHSELAILSAEHRKDLIIEKPVTRTLEELTAIQKAVSENGVRCTVAENYFFKPIIKTIRAFIDDGLVGEVLFLELSKTNRENKSGWRTDGVMMGGGALLEGGVHWLNALTSLAGGTPTEVIAAKPGAEYATQVPLEDSLLLVVKFSNGVVARLLHSWRIPNRFFGMGLSKIYGTEGVITLESNGLFCSVYGKRKKKKVINPREFLGFKAMHRSFIADWVSGRTWEPTLERIREDMKVVWAAYRSLETNRFEKI